MTKVDVKDIRHPSRKIERQAAAKHGWVNWYTDRGHFYGYGAMLRKCMRQHSWRRKH